MNVMQMLKINGHKYKVTNRTDYYLDQWLYSDYGFALYYRVIRRGMAELRWQSMLDDNAFSTDRARGMFWPHIVGVETRNRSLNFHDLIDRPFAIDFVHGGEWYGMAFDGNEFYMQTNDGNPDLTQIVL